LKIHRLNIEPGSPFTTPLQSDTLFGHLAWAIVYGEGEDKLKEVLAEFNLDEPPFLLSEAFPEEMLPVPILPPLTQKERCALARTRYQNASIATLRQLSEDLKRVRKRKYLSVDKFCRVAHNLDSLALARSLLDTIDQVHSKEEVRTHVTINRLTGTATEGALFDRKQTFYTPGCRLTIWLKFRDISWKDDVYRWFKLVAADGFGRRKCIGLGHFRVVGDIIEEEFPAVTDPNAFMSLSSYVPRADDPCAGYYQYLVKRGKLGASLALGGKVWKRPALMFSPGSVFRIDGELRYSYGGLIHNIHSDYPEVVQYAFAFPLPLRIGQHGGSL
jgi:CRISPR-associated protein Csm4